MFDLANARLLARRSKKYWVAALCAASFTCGHYLFGDDDADSSESLLSQYQQATQQLVGEVQLPTARRQPAANKTDAHASRPQPVKAEAAVAETNGPAPPQKSSRRVKPSPQSTTAEAIAKSEAPIETNLKSNYQVVAKEEPTGAKPDLVQNSPAPQTPTEPTATPAENRSLPTVTYIELPPQSAVTQKEVPPQSAATQKDVAIRMEIITQTTAGAESPRSQDPGAQKSPWVVTKLAPMQAEVRSPTKPELSQPLPQIINVSRTIAPPQPPKLAETLAELNDEHLPPIVSPDQVPRPGTRKKPVPQTAQATPVLRIDLGKK